ncbi:hypothetical protein RMCBS344292_15907 [Rhizopus microsporus]|nr:hypothetical protein RMCBS344292_15907 [Rhizopus microsporus]
MVPGLLLGNDYYDISLYLYVSSLMFGSTFTLITIFIPKFVIISRHILQNSKKINIYRMNSDSQNQMSVHSTNSMDQNIQLNLVAKNMYDFTVQAHEGILPVKKMAKFDFLSIWTLKHVHEGILPVKKMAKFDFLSIWTLKHVVLVPFKKYFILSEARMPLFTIMSAVSQP